MKSVFRVAAISAAVLFSLTITKANASVYELQLFSVDDYMSAYITNSVYNQQLMLAEPFGTNYPYVDISSYVEPGSNDITLALRNDIAGYAYTWNFTIDGVLYASGSCGNWNANAGGCNGNSYATGIVYTTDILFTEASPVSNTPLPAALPLFATGLGALGLFGWRRKRKNAAALVAA